MAHTDAHGTPLNHETRDVNLAGAPRFAIGMVVFLAIVFAFIWFIYARWRADADASRPSLPAITVREGDRLPPLPRLQTTPVTDLRGFQESESMLLTTYGWVDKERGVVRIPVSRAIDLVAERGLPAPTAEPVAGEAAGTTPTGTASTPR